MDCRSGRVTTPFVDTHASRRRRTARLCDFDLRAFLDWEHAEVSLGSRKKTFTQYHDATPSPPHSSRAVSVRRSFTMNPADRNLLIQYSCGCSLMWPSPPCPGVAAENTSRRGPEVRVVTRESLASGGRCFATSRQTARSNLAGRSNGSRRSTLSTSSPRLLAAAIAASLRSSPSRSVTPRRASTSRRPPDPQPTSTTPAGERRSISVAAIES